MAQTSSLPKFRIPGLRDLFHDHVGAEKGNDHFPAGSTIVLSGPPGAGKTTFALGLVRSMLLDERAQKVSGKDDRTVGAHIPHHVVYYISTEVDRPRLQRMFGGRGWFRENDLFDPNLSSRLPTGLHVINPPQEIERPVKTSEELVNYVVRQISVQPSPEEGQFVFIIIDSITSLFKDSKGTGEGRRQVHELVLRLREQFAKGKEPTTGGLGYIMLLAEQGIDNLNSPGMETYVADFVLQFGLESLSMGARLRTLEVTKSQGANMMMGQHTWSIVTNQSCQRLIAGEALRKLTYKLVAEAEGRDLEDIEAASNPQQDGKPWGTLVVATRPYFNPTRETRHFKNREDAPSGIRGLDQMLRFDPDYWFGNPDDPTVRVEADKHASIRSSGVTMLVGAPGTGKTTLCYHIIASHLARHPQGQALLVGFEQDLQESFVHFGLAYPKSSDEAGETRPPAGEDKAVAKKLTLDDVKRCSGIYRLRSGLSFNLLLLEIREWLKAHRDVPKRVVLDGISNLAATHTGHDFSQMLDAIVALFSEHPRKEGGIDPEGTSVFLTYESEHTEPVLSADTFRLPADNIVMLSHKVIEDDRRTAVTVIKSSHQEYDSMVRELVLDHDAPHKTHIHSGFDAYSGLLTGNLKRARVVLQLFQENEREKAFNEAACKYLNRLLPYQIELRDFSRFEINASLDERGDQVKVPSGDVQIINMDEWWLAHKVQKLRGEAERAREKKAWIESLNKLMIAEESMRAWQTRQSMQSNSRKATQDSIARWSALSYENRPEVLDETKSMLRAKVSSSVVAHENLVQLHRTALERCESELEEFRDVVKKSVSAKPTVANRVRWLEKQKEVARDHAKRALEEVQDIWQKVKEMEECWKVLEGKEAQVDSAFTKWKVESDKTTDKGGALAEWREFLEIDEAAGAARNRWVSTVAAPLKEGKERIARLLEGGKEFDPSPEKRAWAEFREVANDNHLTKLESFVGTDEKSPISPGDFWCFEMEKVWHPHPEQETGGNIGPYALPYYLDFGMLCLHVDVARALLEKPQGMNASPMVYPGWEEAEEVPWEGEPRGREDFCDLLDKCIVPWCACDEGVWFKGPSDSRGTLVHQMWQYTRALGGQTGAQKYGFAWDSRTPETAACFLYEVAWAFGGDLALFTPSQASEPAEAQKQDDSNRAAVLRALCFIGYLVKEKLMPPCPTLTDTAQAVFSRHYYSTLNDVNLRSATSQNGRRAASQGVEASPYTKIQPTLLSLGFMPPGPTAWQTTDSMMVDELDRSVKLAEREEAKKRNRSGVEDRENIECLRSPNDCDVEELKRWMNFRDRLRNSACWADALGTGDPQRDRGAPELRTGYGCCGAWMIGVKSPTAAPGIAQVLLQEITSLSFAKKRARMGAGFPARQDFYRYYGDRPVTGMEYIRWNEILEFLASKSRRRDRIYPKNGSVDPGTMHKYIHRSVTTIMQTATEEDKDVIIAEAKKLTERLFEAAKKMSEASKKY